MDPVSSKRKSHALRGDDHAHGTRRTDRSCRGCGARGINMPKIIITASLMVLILCACAALRPASDIPSPQDLFDACNGAFRGKSFDAVRMRYGQPDGQVPFGQLTVYQFRNANSVRLQEPVTTTTTGAVGTPNSYVPYAQNTTGWQGYNQDMKCMMRVGVKPDGTVDGVDFVGQMGACQVFMP